MMPTFQRWPSVWMTHQRVHVASTRHTSAAAASIGRNGRRSQTTSLAAPARIAACSSAIHPKLRSGIGTAPSRIMARRLRAEMTSSANRSIATAPTTIR
jgi:hypothetical protein